MVVEQPGTREPGRLKCLSLSLFVCVWDDPGKTNVIVRWRRSSPSSVTAAFSCSIWYPRGRDLIRMSNPRVLCSQSRYPNGLMSMWMPFATWWHTYINTNTLTHRHRLKHVVRWLWNSLHPNIGNWLFRTNKRTQTSNYKFWGGQERISNQ